MSWFSLKTQSQVFDSLTYITYLLLILSAFGVAQWAPIYVHDIDLYSRVYISIFLLFRFNPWSNVTLTDLDRKIAFSAGALLLTTTFLGKYVAGVKQRVVQKVRTEVDERKNVLQ
jgi:hypothetical protein